MISKSNVIREHKNRSFALLSIICIQIFWHTKKGQNPVLVRLLLGQSPSYKIGFLRKSQMAKRGLLCVRYMLAESGTVAVSLLYLSMNRERDKV